jgi:hypothetical protein
MEFLTGFGREAKHTCWRAPSWGGAAGVPHKCEDKLLFSMTNGTFIH